MTGSRCAIAAAIVLGALTVGGAARAQENLDAGKTGAQLFASDCAMCHKTPQGLSKAGGLFGLAHFLGMHYTSSEQSARTIADYLAQVDRGAHAAPARATRRPHHKPAHKTKAGEKAKADPKADTKSDTKSDTKPAPKEDAKKGAPDKSDAPSMKPDKDKKSGKPAADAKSKSKA